MSVSFRQGANRTRILTLVILSAFVAPAATALAHPVTYTSSGSPCQPIGLVAPNLVTCPTRIDQEGALDVLGCAGPEPAICTVTDQGTATGRGAPALPREIRLLLVDQGGRVAPALVCERSASATTDIAVACSGSVALGVPLALGTCTELRTHAEMTNVVGDVHALMTQTELAYRLCRSAAGALSLARA